ncbi:hypothetical protein Tsubulata_029836 [Turnera subulata]|uniref:AB hydrolase-1 domain-containing protein n=1 Tax=Turnera subulata TaxID=218843 RepID=A0A9Q0J5L1_9ROSI|nr:hypothetical protein Tsubulata_029836 [Turnera subulata]
MLCFLLHRPIMVATAVTIQSDVWSALFDVNANRRFLPRAASSSSSSTARWPLLPRRAAALRGGGVVRAFSNEPSPSPSPPSFKLPEKPPVCTADELHYVSLPNSDWRLALWRYHPCPKAPPRNHPLVLLSGVGTNAIGYDLSPGSSFARYMSDQGFDTWILEVRGAGLSVRESDVKDIEQSSREASDQIEAVAKSAISGALSEDEEQTDCSSSISDSDISGLNEDLPGKPTVWDESQLVSKLTETFMLLAERLSGFLNEGQSRIMSAKLVDQISRLLEDTQLSERFNEIRVKLLSLLEARQNSGLAIQIRDLSQRLVNIVEEGQKSVSPQLFDLQGRLSSTIEDFHKQLELIVKYDWDFDNYLEEDVPAVMEYIRRESKPKDGKLLAIGHSMGGILLYARLSRCGKTPVIPMYHIFLRICWTCYKYTSNCTFLP